MELLIFLSLKKNLVSFSIIMEFSKSNKMKIYVYCIDIFDNLHFNQSDTVQEKNSVDVEISNWLDVLQLLQGSMEYCKMIWRSLPCFIFMVHWPFGIIQQRHQIALST